MMMDMKTELLFETTEFRNVLTQLKLPLRETDSPPHEW